MQVCSSLHTPTHERWRLALREHKQEPSLKDGLGQEFNLIQKPHVVYDGICNLCTGAVRFLNLIDRSRTIEYKPYQELGLRVRRKYGMSDREFQGRMHLIRGDNSLVSGPGCNHRSMQTSRTLQTRMQSIQHIIRSQSLQFHCGQTVLALRVQGIMLCGQRVSAQRSECAEN